MHTKFYIPFQIYQRSLLNWFLGLRCFHLSRFHQFLSILCNSYSGKQNCLYLWRNVVKRNPWFQLYYRWYSFGIYGFYNEDNTYHQVYILRIYYFSHYQFRDCSNKPFFRKIYNNPLDYCSKRVHNQRIYRNLMRPLGIQPHYQEVGLLHQSNLSLDYWWSKMWELFNYEKRKKV